MEVLINNKEALIEACPNLNDNMYQAVIENSYMVIECAKDIGVVEQYLP